MKIDPELCVSCGTCLIYCPLGAIHINDVAEVDQETCVECGNCIRAEICPVDAFIYEAQPWPRSVREAFSNPLAEHKETRVPGRGTEEMKTNDVSNRFGTEEYGVSIELGRPGVGTQLKNIELFTTKFSQIGVEYEPMSPVTAILSDDKVKIKDDIRDERVLSAIIEFKVPKKKINQVLQIIKEVEKEIDTVFTVGIVSRIMEDGSIPIIDVLEQQGFKVKPNAKINIGLGRA